MTLIQKVRVTNPKGEVLELELTNPEKSGLIVANIEGLGPPTASINGQEMATADGMIFSSARASTRNVVFTLAMLSRDASSKYGALSIEQSRHLTYRYFPIKKEIKMEFITDVRTTYCTGHVETNNPVIFSQEEYTQISVICPDPYLYEEGGEKTVFSGIQPAFEFPFSNESFTEPLLEFGTIWLDTRAILDYRGTVDTGVLITIHAMGDLDPKRIRLYNVDTMEHLIIDTTKIETITGVKYSVKDDIIISTTKGDRYCRLLHDGAYTNIIGVISKDSDWFQISNGNNGFAFAADSDEQKLSVTFSYKNAYVGV